MFSCSLQCVKEWGSMGECASGEGRDVMKTGSMGWIASSDCHKQS